MTVCPNCGAENPDKSKWCGKCRYNLYKEYLQKTRLYFYIGCFLLGIYCILSLFRLSDPDLWNDIENMWWSISSFLWFIKDFLKLSDLIFGMVLLIFHCISRIKQSRSNILKTVFYFYNVIHFLFIIICHWRFGEDLVILLVGFFYSIYGIWYANKNTKFTVFLLLIVFLLLSFTPRIYNNGRVLTYRIFEPFYIYPYSYASVYHSFEYLIIFESWIILLDKIMVISIFIVVLLFKNTKFFSFSRTLFLGYGIFRIIFSIALIMINVIAKSEFTVFSQIFCFVFYDFTRFAVIPITYFLITKSKEHLSIHHK